MNGNEKARFPNGTMTVMANLRRFSEDMIKWLVMSLPENVCTPPLQNHDDQDIVQDVEDQVTVNNRP